MTRPLALSPLAANAAMQSFRRKDNVTVSAGRGRGIAKKGAAKFVRSLARAASSFPLHVEVFPPREFRHHVAGQGKLASQKEEEEEASREWQRRTRLGESGTAVRLPEKLDRRTQSRGTSWGRGERAEAAEEGGPRSGTHPLQHQRQFRYANGSVGTD